MDEGRAEEEITTEASRWDDRYGALFLLILLSMLLSAANTTWLKVVAVTVQGGMVLFAFLVSRAPRRAWRLAIVLVPIAVILGIVGHVSDSKTAESITAVVAVILPVAAIVVLVRRIVEDLPSVSARTILGLLSVYLLIGMTFAALFTTIAVISDEPFFAQTETAEPVDFTYFSYVTLSTVGYGDFTAANPMPRMLAAIEGLAGQLYLVTVVAVAVSRVRTRRSRPPGG
ncbi:MAG: ion channel [Actinomycetota bacterium]